MVSLPAMACLINSADLNSRDQFLMKTVLVINLEVKDNHEEAAIGGQLALELCLEVLLQITTLYFSTMSYYTL